MNYYMIERRIAKLERAIANKFEDLDKPTRAEERIFVENLFNKYESLRNTLSYETSEEDDTFHLVLRTKNKEKAIMKFIITANGSRSNMKCKVVKVVNNKEVKLGSINFKLDEDMNTVALFILSKLHEYKYC